MTETMNLTERTLASGSVAIVNDDGVAIAIIPKRTKPVPVESLAPVKQERKESGLGRTPEQSRYARKVWMDLGSCATKYGYKSDRLSGFARRRAYRRIMHAAGVPTLTNGRSHG